jgi:hypothetical protein
MFAAVLMKLGRLSRHPSNARRPVTRPPRFVPQLVRLEDRTLPNVFRKTPVSKTVFSDRGSPSETPTRGRG